MGDVYKVNLTWTSPMVTYEPSGAWRQAATIQNDSTATFEFYGNGLKWFGSANSSTYTISLDDVPQTVSPRKFVPLSGGEGPTDVWCNYTIPWECMVLAEFDDLDPNTQHKIQLHTAFNETSLGKNTVNLLAMQVSYNTSQPERTLIQDYKVDMDDDKLIYAGNWFNVTYDPNNYTRSMEPGSTISLQFRGYSISVWGTNDISTSPYDISLDGHTESYTFPEVSSKDKEVLLWYKAGLDQNAQHTVVVTNQGTDGLIVSGFKYTRLQDPSNPDSTDPDSFTGSPSSSGGLSKGAIAGIVLGVLFAFFLLISYFLYRRILRIRSKNSGGDGSNGGGGAQGQANSRLSLRALLGGSSGSSSVGHISPWEDPRNVEAQPAAAPALAPVVVTANLPQMQQIVFQQVYPQGELPTDQPPPFEPLPTVGQSNANGSPTTPTSTHPPMRKERLTIQSPNATTSSNNRASAAVVGTNNTNGGGPAVIVVDTDNVIVERERGSISSASANGDAAATSRVVAQHKPALFPAPASTSTPTPTNTTTISNTNGNPGTGTQTPRSPSSPASERHAAEQEVVVGRQSPDRAMLSPTPTLTSPSTGGDASDNSRRNTHQTVATVNTASPIRRDSSTNNVVITTTTTTTTTTNTATGDAGGDPESQIPERPATPPPAYEGPSPDAAGGSSSNAAQRRREARDRKAAAEPRPLGVTND